MSNPAAEQLLLTPEKWHFSVGEEERHRVREAHQGYVATYGAAPDLFSLRIMLMGGFKGDPTEMLRFWDKVLLADMPVSSAVEGCALEQTQNLWRSLKLDHIVSSLGLEPLTVYESRTISGCLMSPDQLRAAADELARLESEGFAMSSHEMDEEADPPIFTWYLRRKKKR